METVDLSVLVPARHEEFLNRTIEDVLEHRQGMTEIIVGLDGEWPMVPIPDNERVTIVYSPTPIGQRAITNDCARVARGYYVMKLDAHCSVAPGFDLSMLEAFEETGDEVVMAPVMKNLHVFDLVCPNGHRRYQGHDDPCKECGEPVHKEIVWKAKDSPNSRAYCFDPEPHFQYARWFSKRPEGKGDITESMSLQGSCWMMTKKNYFDLEVCDESWGTWGSQGIEIAAKFWLSGRRVLINQKTWHAHAFRTQGGSWGFPYALSGRQVEHAKKKARELIYTNNWSKQTRPSSWLIEKFKPIPGWHDESGKDALMKVMDAGIAFTNLRLENVGRLGVVSSVPGPMANHATPVAIDGSG